MSLLEAKECSLPIVSFDIPTGPAEVVLDGVNGFLFPPFDCDAMAQRISQLIQDNAVRARFSAHAKGNIEEFQMRNVLNRWNRILETVAAESHGTRA